MKTQQPQNYQFSSVQSLSCVRLLVTPWIAARQASLSIINSQSLLKLMSIESVMSSSHLILCHPLLLLPSISPSHQGLFKWVSSLHQVAKVLEFQLHHQSFQRIFRTDLQMDWFDLLAVQGTLKSLLQHHSSKALILRQSAFFIVQLSHLTILEKHLGHRVSDVIQPFHSLLSPSPPAPNPSQHRYLFQLVISSHKVAKVLGFQLQHLSFQWTLRTDL